MIHLDQDKYDQKPLQRFEIITIVVLSISFLSLLAMDILTNFQPRKLSFLAFTLSWIPLLFIHEFGHAIMAKLLNWKIQYVNIGIGPKLMRTHFLGAPMDIRAIPLEGFVQTYPTSMAGIRFKHALVYFAGPGIELLIFFSIMGFLGTEQMFTVTDNYGDIFLKSFAFAALVGAVINLIPLGIRSNQGTTPNDGLGILQSLFASKKTYETWMQEIHEKETQSSPAKDKD